MAIEISQNKKISGGGKNGGREGVLLFVREEQIGGRRH